MLSHFYDSTLVPLLLHVRPSSVLLALSSATVDRVVEVVTMLLMVVALPLLKQLADRAPAGRKKDALEAAEALARTIVGHLEDEVRDKKASRQWNDDVAKEYGDRAKKLLAAIAADELKVLAAGKGAETTDQLVSMLIEAQKEAARRSTPGEPGDPSALPSPPPPAPPAPPA